MNFNTEIREEDFMDVELPENLAGEQEQPEEEAVEVELKPDLFSGIATCSLSSPK